MKRSHFTTPRNLADCDFTVGYPSSERDSLLGRLGGAVMIGYALAMMVPA